jgi:hypothetical protein
MTILKRKSLVLTMNYQAESQQIVDAINKSLEILKRIESKQ